MCEDGSQTQDDTSLTISEKPQNLTVILNLESWRLEITQWTEEAIAKGVEIVKKLMKEDPRIKGTPNTKTSRGYPGVDLYIMATILRALGWKPVADALIFEQLVSYEYYCINCFIEHRVRRNDKDWNLEKETHEHDALNIDGNPCCPNCRHRLVSWSNYIQRVKFYD